MTVTSASENVPATQAPKKATLRQLIEQMKPEIARALPSHMTPERMARIATTAIKQNPKLGECTPESFLGALMTASQLGLEPNTPLGEAYLVPFKNKNKATGRYEMVCTYIQGYRGLVQLAHRSGQVAMVKAQVVYEKDDFEFEEGLDAFLKHKRSRDADRGEVIWVYATVKLKDGGSNFVVMTVPEVEAIRKRSKAADSGPWVTDWNAMAKKTALKQLSKWMPLSPEFAVASRLDETVRKDMNTELVDVQPDYVDGEVVEDAPGLGGGNDQGEGAEPSSGAESHAPPGDQEPPVVPPPDVVYAGEKELAKLTQVIDAEGHDEESWADFVHASIGRRVKDNKELTLAEAQQLLDIFNGEDGAK